MERCSIFLSDTLAKVPRAERPELVFTIIAAWVIASLCGTEKPDNENEIVADIATAVQNETAGFWTLRDK